jgi:hypothetical protein
MNKYTLGNTVRLRAVLLDDKDVELDASTVRCAVEAPGSTTATEVTVRPDGPARVVAEYVPNKTGIHTYAFSNLSPLVNSEKTFLVLPRAVNPLS